MLDKIRKIFAGFVIKLLLILLIGAIGLWGISGRQAGQPYVATVGKDGYIYVQDFARAQQNFINLMRQNYPSLPLDSLNVKHRVLNNLIQNKLFELEAKRLGLYVSNDVVIEQIKIDPSFKDKSGNFDRDRFKQILQRSDVSEANYVQNLKNIAATKALAAIIPELQPPSLLVNKLYNYNNQKRVVEVMLINAVGDDNSQITEQQMTEYYNSHKGLFTTTEYRDIEYIVIKPSAIKLKSEEVMYEKIKEIEDGLAAGTSLKEVADKYKIEYKVAQQLDRNNRKLNLSEKVLEEAFTLPVNHISETLQPDEIKAEYYIINVQKIEPAFVKPMAAVTKEITSALQEQSRENNTRDYASQVYSKFRSDPTYKQNLLSKTLKLTRPDSLSDNSSGLLDAATVAATFDLKYVGESTHLFKTKEGKFAFVVLKEIQPDRVSPNNKEYKNLEAKLSEYVTSLMHQEFINYMYLRHGVKTDMEALSQ